MLTYQFECLFSPGPFTWPILTYPPGPFTLQLSYAPPPPPPPPPPYAFRVCVSNHPKGKTCLISVRVLAGNDPHARVLRTLIRSGRRLRRRYRRSLLLRWWRSNATSSRGICREPRCGLADITGARAKAWCLLIHAEASLSFSLSLLLSGLADIACHFIHTHFEPSNLEFNVIL